MVICLCIDKLGSGGAERVLTSLANSFSIMGHTVYLIETSTSHSKPFYFINEDIRHVQLLDNDSKRSYLSKIKSLRKLLKNIRPNVVISFKYQTNFNVFFSLLGTKIKHIVSERNDPYRYNIGLFSKLFKKMIFKMSDGCVFQTKDAMRYYYKKSNKKCSIIPNPINVGNGFFDKRKRNNTILSVGRLEKQKNTKMLIDSFEIVHKKYPHFILKLYGVGNLEEELKKYAFSKTCGKNVIFCGNSNKWQLDELESSVFVLSSNYEGMPNSLMEAMAIGIPSISTDCPIGGPKELIADKENGILIPVGSVESLTNSILLLIEDEELAYKISNANKYMAYNYSSLNIAKKWIEFIDKVIK